MISVCIATYNGSKFIKEQISSILPQLDINDEIIISDDGSKDDTLALVESFMDTRIRVFKNIGSKGYTNNFQNALMQAKGDYIFLSDQDDIWVADKVCISLSYLKKYDVIISDAVIVDETAQILASSFFKQRNTSSYNLINAITFRGLGCCICFHNKLLKKALPFPSNHILATHDNWLFIVGYFFFSVKFVDDKLILYRKHSSNTSQGENYANTKLRFKIIYRIYLVYSLFKRLF